MTGMWNEVRYAARGLARAPQFTIPAALTLALVIGANASIFSAVWGVLLKPLPFPNAERLITIWHTAPGMDAGWDLIPMSLGTFEIYQEYGDLFESAGLYRGTTVNVTGDGAEPERVEAARVSRSVLPTLGMPLLLGRGFDEAEDRPNGPKVAILSHGLWRDRFGGDRQIIGKTIRVNGEAHEIIGVLPERFVLSRSMWQPGTATRLLLPLALGDANRGDFSYSAIARLKPGIDAGLAESTLKQAIERVRAGLGDEEADFRALIDQGRLAPVAESLRGSVVRDLTQPLWLLLGTAGFVFLIACANVTNLFLVRAEARQKEMAVRAALGTGRGRLIGHYLAEAGLIALAGGVAGLGLARIGVPVLLRAAPTGIPRLDAVGIDPLVLVFVFAITLAAAVLLGIVPSLRLTRLDVLATLSRSARGPTASRDRNRTRQMLVVVQTALALVLLIGSALMLRSFQKLRAVDPGFRAEHTLTFRMSLPATTYAEAERVNAFHGELLDRLRALPGVEAVGATSDLPLACCSSADHVVEGRPIAPGEPPLFLSYSSVIDGYFQAMGIPIIAGRSFDTRDRAADGRTIIVSDALARRFWADSDPIGKRVRRAWSDTTGRGGWRTIIGVAGNVRAERLDEEPTAMVYYPAASTPVAGQARNVTYVVHGRQPEALAPLVRREVWALDASLPIAATQTLERVVADSMARLSFTMLALAVAAAIALFLGAIGLYGVTSYLVTQRTNEIGIRIALGARPGQVRSMVVLQGLRLAGLGLALGFVAALALTRVLQGLLFGTEPTDPATFAAMLAFLTAIALLATYLPARRASRIDPAASLKAE